MPDGGTPAAPASAGAILRKTANGAGWVVGWRMARRLLGFASTIVLARLLVPSDFGLVALATSIAGALEAVSSLGVEDAIVRARDPSRELFDTGFTINLLRGIGTAIAVAIAAWPTARFFGDLRLWPVMLALAAASLVGSLTNIGTVDFRRTISFDKEFVLLIVPRVIGAIATMTVALLTRSYWALVIGIVTSRVVGVMASYWMHPYRPRLGVSCWRELAGFSFWVWVIGLVQMIRDRLDQLMIGKLLGDRAVGFLSVSWEIAHLPTTELVGPLGRASFAGFSAAQYSGVDVGKMYMRVMGAVCLVALPTGIGVSAVAAPLVRLLLGTKWSAVAPVVALAAVVSVSAGLGLITTNVLTAFGKMKAQFQITCLFTVVRVLLLLFFIPRYGLLGAITAAGIGMALEFGTYIALAARQFGLAATTFLGAIWRPVVGVSAMAAMLTYTHLGWLPVGGSIGGAVVSVALASAAGAGVYCASVGLLWVVSGKPEPSAESDLTELMSVAGRRLFWRAATLARSKRAG